MSIAAQAQVVMARSQPNHHHHHHHVSTSSASSSTTTTAKGLFDFPSAGFEVGYGYGYGGGGGSYVSASNHVKSSSRLLPPSAITPLRLAGRDKVTRVKLQKQRELHPVATHLVGDRIPGFRTSAGMFYSSLDVFLQKQVQLGFHEHDLEKNTRDTRKPVPFLQEHLKINHPSPRPTAFFASLRTNLRLHASPPSSPMSTPPSMGASTASLLPPSPLSGPAESPDPNTDPLAGVPELHSYIAHGEEDRTAALKLVADSVAQMRQTANMALISHPLNLALAVGLLSLLARYVYDSKRDWSLMGTSCAGVLMALLALCRWLTQGYLHTAEDVDWSWVRGGDVFVTKFGHEIIGAAVVEWVSGESSRQKRKKAWRGEIRAWTVRLKYRGKGVGTALLEDVVKEAGRKGAESLEFAEDHASEYLPLD